MQHQFGSFLSERALIVYALERPYCRVPRAAILLSVNKLIAGAPNISKYLIVAGRNIHQRLNKVILLEVR